jgi:hypothetical protein
MSDELSFGAARYIVAAGAVLVLMVGGLHLLDQRKSEAELAELRQRMCERPLPPALLEALDEVDVAGDQTRSAAPALLGQWAGWLPDARPRILYERGGALKEQSWSSSKLEPPWGGEDVDQLKAWIGKDGCGAQRAGDDMRGYRALETRGGTRVLLLVQRSRG